MLNDNLVADVSVLAEFNTLEKLKLRYNPLSSNYPEINRKIIANNPGIDLDDEQITICNDQPIISNNERYIAFQVGFEVSGLISPYLFGNVKIVETANNRLHSVPYSEYTIATAWATQDNKPVLYYATADDNRMLATNIKRCYFEPSDKLVHDKDYCLKFEPFLMSHLSVSPDGDIILAYESCDALPRKIGNLTVFNNEKQCFYDTDFFVSPEINISWINSRTAIVLAVNDLGKGDLLQIEFDDSGNILKQSCIVPDCQFFWGTFNGQPVFNRDCSLFSGSKYISPASGISKIFISLNTMAVIKCRSIDIYDKNLDKINTIEFERASKTYCYSETEGKLYGQYKIPFFSDPNASDASTNIFSTDINNPGEYDLFLDIKIDH